MCRVRLPHRSRSPMRGGVALDLLDVLGLGWLRGEQPSAMFACSAYGDLGGASSVKQAASMCPRRALGCARSVAYLVRSSLSADGWSRERMAGYKRQMFSGPSRFLFSFRVLVVAMALRSDGLCGTSTASNGDKQLMVLGRRVSPCCHGLRSLGVFLSSDRRLIVGWLSTDHRLDVDEYSDCRP